MPASVDKPPCQLNANPDRRSWITDVAHFPHRPSLADIRELEFDFCRDFACCGQTLGDLHDLLEHYEECHVRFEEEETVPMELTEDASVDDVLVSDDLDLTMVMPPLVGMKRVNLSDKDESIPVCPSSISNIDGRGHKRQRSVPPESPRPHLTIETMNLPTSFSAVTTPTALGEDFLAHAGLVDASSALASFSTQDANANKPFRCSVQGCDKAYKNPNGLKYHNLHGHHGNNESDTEKKLQRPFECTIGSCNKRYKNLNGLKYHVEHSHLMIINNHLNHLVPRPSASPRSSCSP
ncbi:hypothetical protein INT44_009018 [Umbelopsis vinacea]|uniref:C2H2-type domain-containing protein n=1 Tax=Umbelopsis vinacea TaxID=44442 RepID=A0A8H7Q164_9FUNG|nr:hypothetical protein INT44_009018 [Umbelopsis vinacea]